MNFETFTMELQEAFNSLLSGIVEFVPELLIAIVIFIVGWVVGSVLGSVVAQVVQSLRVDEALKKAGLSGVFSRAGYELQAGKFLGALIKWFIILVFLVASLDVLGLTQVNEFLKEIVLTYLPQVIAAVLILLVAAVIAEVVQNVVSGAAKAANITSANFLGTVARWAIWVFAILAALSQLSIAEEFVQTLFTGVIVALSLAFGLAFGLGGQQAAADYLDRLKREMTTKK